VITERKMHGGSLGGAFAPCFVDVLKTYEEKTVFTKQTNIMFAAHRAMWQKSIEEDACDYDKHTTTIYQSLPGNLIMNVPGDACGIHPNEVRTISEGMGYNFACHNVDNMLQQLTLVTGLAAMCDLVETHL